MNNKRYGTIFKGLRLQKGLSLSAFKELGISKTSLFNFEEGNTMMGFDRVNIALKKLGYSLAHYEELLNNYEPHYLENTVNKIEEAWISQNLSFLQQIQNDSMENGAPIISLVAQGCYSSLSEGDCETITSYLYELTTWDYTDINIFFLSLDHMSQKDIIFLLEKLLKNKEGYFKNNLLRWKISEVLLRSSYLFIFQNNQVGANYLLNKLNDRIFSAFHVNVKNLISGCYEYKFINKITGETKINEALRIIKKLVKKEVSDFYVKKVNAIR